MRNSIRMRQGYNSLGGVSYSTDLSYCAAPAQLTSFGDSSGESVVLYIASAKSEKSLQDEITKSLSFGIEYGDSREKKSGELAQSINNLAGNFDFSSKRDQHSAYREKSVYVIIRARKTFSSEALSEFKAAEDTKSFFVDRPQEFFNRCGDHFVSGVKKGAEITAYMRCDTTSQEVKDKIANTIAASGGLKGLSSKGTIEEILAMVRQETEETCIYSLMPQGGSGTIRTDNEHEFINSTLSYLGNATPATAVPIEFETMPYGAILDRDFHDKILNQADLKLENQRAFVLSKSETMSSLSHEVGRLLDLGQSSPSVLDPLLKAIEKTRTEIDGCLRDVYNSAACAAKAKWPIPSRVPKRT